MSRLDALQNWAGLICIQDDLKIRDPGSKHQKQMKRILDLVLEARVNPSESIIEKLFEINPIHCLGQTPYVCNCRYLQYAIVELRNILKNEG